MSRLSTKQRRVSLAFVGAPPLTRWRRFWCRLGIHDRRICVHGADGVRFKVCPCGDGRNA